MLWCFRFYRNFPFANLNFGGDLTIDMYLYLDSASVVMVEAGSTSHFRMAAMLNGPVKWPHLRSEEYRILLQNKIFSILKRFFLHLDRKKSCFKVDSNNIRALKSKFTSF